MHERDPHGVAEDFCMRIFLLAAATAASWPVWAQSSLPPVVVTGNPLRSDEIATPASVLAGTGLVLRRASTLGETLDGLPGVTSTYFGPNANRPVIRGQDGDRIRILSNAATVLDASGLSFDHAVPIDPLIVERIEVLRGPAALLYGGSAIGGVVNAIDNRIPKAPTEGLSGAFEARAGGAAGERSLSALVEGSGGGFAWHADAFGRRSEDLRVPAFEVPIADAESERRRRVVNSAGDAHGGALGGSWFWDRGQLGASVDSYRNDYGIVVEEDIRIRMQRDRLALAGEWRPAAAFVQTLRAQLSRTDYTHREIEGDGSVGTTFRTDGSDGRAEAVHRPVTVGGGQREGSWGLQFDASSFSALGEEAFVPSTRTRQDAVFALEKWTWGPGGHLTAGVRAERVKVRSEGDRDPAEPQFGPADARSFTPFSASFGAVVNLGKSWQLTSSLASTERAPTSYELYANGVHAATATFERGDPDQRLERGRNADLALAWRSGEHRVRIGVFESRFSNYILLAATGEPDFVDDEGEAVPVFAFTGVRARLRGMEAEGQWRILDGASKVDVEVRVDRVRGSELDTDEPLPRIPPLRDIVGLNIAAGPWTARAEIQHAADQTRVPRYDVPTDGWTLVNLSASYTLRVGRSDALLFARVHNVGDRLAYSATATGTVRPLAPLPGRALLMGVRAAF